MVLLVTLYVFLGLALTISVVLCVGSVINLVRRQRSIARARRRYLQAETLLQQVIGIKLYTHFRLTGYFDVPSKLDPDLVYRVARNGPLVLTTKKGELKGAICIQLVGEFPSQDAVAATYLLAKYDEPRIFTTGKAVALYPGGHHLYPQWFLERHVPLAG